MPNFARQDSVERGDVVLFAFPINEDAEHSAKKPKRRPCLVLDVITRNGTTMRSGTTEREHQAEYDECNVTGSAYRTQIKAIW